MLCPCEEVTLSVLRTIGKILSYFQKEFKEAVCEAEEMDMRVFCSLTNSNIKFLIAIKSFFDKIVKLGIISSEDIVLVILNLQSHLTTQDYKANLP